MASPACPRYSGLPPATSSVEMAAMADVRAVMVLLPCCRDGTGRGAGHGVRGHPRDWREPIATFLACRYEAGNLHRPTAARNPIRNRRGPARPRAASARGAAPGRLPRSRPDQVVQHPAELPADIDIAVGSD